MPPPNSGAHFDEPDRKSSGASLSPPAGLSACEKSELNRMIINGSHAAALAVVNLLMGAWCWMVMNMILEHNELTLVDVQAGIGSAGVYIGLIVCSILLLSCVAAGCIPPSAQYLSRWLIWRACNVVLGGIALSVVMAQV